MASAKQLAWRKKFARMSKAGKFKKITKGGHNIKTGFLTKKESARQDKALKDFDLIVSLKKWAKRGDESSILALKELKRKGKKKFFEDMYR